MTSNEERLDPYDFKGRISSLLTLLQDKLMADTQSWPDLAIGLYDKLTGRNAEITYEFDNMEIMVPSSTGSEATHAKWNLNGSVKIRTKDNG